MRGSSKATLGVVLSAWVGGFGIGQVAASSPTAGLERLPYQKKISSPNCKIYVEQNLGVRKSKRDLVKALLGGKIRDYKRLSREKAPEFESEMYKVTAQALIQKGFKVFPLEVEKDFRGNFLSKKYNKALERLKKNKGVMLGSSLDYLAKSEIDFETEQNFWRKTTNFQLRLNEEHLDGAEGEIIYNQSFSKNYCSNTKNSENDKAFLTDLGKMLDRTLPECEIEG